VLSEEAYQARAGAGCGTLGNGFSARTLVIAADDDE
jgi:hypothetical protein